MQRRSHPFTPLFSTTQRAFWMLVLAVSLLLGVVLGSNGSARSVASLTPSGIVSDEEAPVAQGPAGLKPPRPVRLPGKPGGMTWSG
ncbi:MAG: hypothetical protein H0T73_19995 [Ardenticatenales bacterium]|nr:hypothetical protein [Ardenticatenales bacterium]